MAIPAHINPQDVGFLFDLDGVLVDTARFHFAAWRNLALSLGTDFTEAQNEQLKGVSRKESLQKILDWGGVSLSHVEFEKAMERKNEEYLKLVATLTPTDILPGARAFLEAARASGVATALGSASKNAVMILEQLHIKHLLDAVIDGTSVTQSKPDPEVFLRGAKAIGKQPSYCVVFEDAVSGLQAARAGGMRSVGIGDPSILNIADTVRPSLQEISVEEAISLL